MDGYYVFDNHRFTINCLIAFSLWAMVSNKMIGYFGALESARILNTIFGVFLAAVIEMSKFLIGIYHGK